MLEISLLISGNNGDVVQKLIGILIIAVLGVIIYLIVLNIRTLKIVMKLQTSDKKSKIDDERYHELNNKIQLIIVVSSILILIAGFLGYNSIETIKSEVVGSFEALQDEYRLNAKTYFVDGIKIDKAALTDNNKNIQISFKKLGELNAKIPPIFDQEPFVWAMARGNGFVTIKKITKEYFEYTFSGTMQLKDALLEINTGKKTNLISEGDATSFDLIILEGKN